MAVLSGLHYFDTRVIQKGVNLSEVTNKTIDRVTLKVNGGYIQRNERRELVKEALGVLY